MSKQKPEVDFPGGDAPTELIITDDVIGTGAEAGPGDTVSVHYVGVAHSTGEEFDASYNRGTRWSSDSDPEWSSPAGTRASRA